MDERITALSRYRLEKALDDLASAELLLKNNHYAQSVNRSYYAIFHSVRSLLAYDRFDSKKHSGIIAFFNQNYIRTEKIAVEFFRILTGAETIRNDSDYDDFYSPTPEQALKQLENARVFVKMIQTYISAQMD